jgi:hypothetical protein
MNGSGADNSITVPMMAEVPIEGPSFIPDPPSIELIDNL